MKILYIVHIRLPTERAHGIQIMKMCGAFALSGNGVELVIPKRFNHLKEEPFTYYGEKKNFKVTKIFSFDFDLGKLGRIKFWLQYFSFITSAIFYVFKKKPDIVYVREIVLAYLLSLFGVKVVFEDHELPRSNLFFYKFFLKRIKKKVIVAHNLKAVYEQLGVKNNSYIIIPNGVDIDEFSNINKDKSIFKELGLKGGTKAVLYVGHFYKWKGVYTLLDSIGEMAENATAVLIGGTVENMDDINKYITENGIERVVVSGFAPHKKVIQFIKSADVLILPNTAKEKRSAMYTTPIKLFEYMASGVPIVASNLPSFSKYLKDEENSLLFEPDNARSLAEKVNILLGNHSAGEKLSRKAYDEVHEFTWQKRVEKILNFVNN